MVAKMARQRASVDAAESRNPIALQLRIKSPLASCMSDVCRELAHHQGTALHPSGFGGVVATAVVADERVGHHHHLARIGGIGDHLLVPGHAGVEDNLAIAGVFQGRAEEDPLIRCTGFEGETPAHLRHFPPAPRSPARAPDPGG